MREAIVFVTFVVIFVTLVGQGLSLIPLLRWLKLAEDGDGEQREIDVRVAALKPGWAGSPCSSRPSTTRTSARC